MLICKLFSSENSLPPESIQLAPEDNGDHTSHGRIMLLESTNHETSIEPVRPSSYSLFTDGQRDRTSLQASSLLIFLCHSTQTSNGNNTNIFPLVYIIE